MNKPRWCELCGEWVYSDEEVESQCAYLDCPIVPVVIRNTGDELGPVLADALDKAKESTR
jgi:hypothetical protein